MVRRLLPESLEAGSELMPVIAAVKKRRPQAKAGEEVDKGWLEKCVEPEGGRHSRGRDIA